MKHLIVALILLAAISGAGYLSYRHLIRPDLQCELCGRMTEPDRVSTVFLASGEKIRTCCARCALHYREIHSPEQVSRILVADFETGQQIEASRAIYLEGSDAAPCRAPDEPAPREPGVAYDLAYDRCLPGLLAFRNESAARMFSAAHGGRVLGYAGALASVRAH